MIAGCFERLGQIFENTAALVGDLRSFAVHQLLRPHYFAAKTLRDALMAEANAENWNLRSELADQFGTDSCVFRTTRTRRNTDPVRFKFLDFVDRNFVVPLYHQIDIVHLAEKLNEIIGEGIIVIDDQQFHSSSPSQSSFFSARTIADSIAFALLTHSSNSLVGFESATMPAPACKYAFPFFKIIDRMAMQLSCDPSKPK